MQAGAPEETEKPFSVAILACIHWAYDQAGTVPSDIAPGAVQTSDPS